MNSRNLCISLALGIAASAQWAHATIIPFTDNFASGPLDASFSLVGSGGAYNGTGQYVITDTETGTGTIAGLQRTIGVGDFRARLDAVNITSTASGNFVYYWQIRDAASFAAPGIAVGLGLGSPNMLTTFLFDSSGNITQQWQTALPSGTLPENLDLSITWRGAPSGGGQWDELYDTSGGTPTTEFNGGPFHDTYDAQPTRTMYAFIDEYGTTGTASAGLDYFSIVPEPTSLATLSIGALALLARRRIGVT
ncbi:MAG TPA: PEP-CTERM sorting domain-containing protein [Phycisphaerae bacterium]|nr:PEP-CTERM sorting domain-containing protein [Phycisphaerae bacterium]